MFADDGAEVRQQTCDVLDFVQELVKR